MNNSHTECICNHLSHFAVLMDYAGESLAPEEIKILGVLTYIGVALSVFGLFITVACYILLTDRQTPLAQIRISLATCLGLGHITFLAGIDITDNKEICIAAAVIMQYFFMAAFCWMLMEGIYLYLFVVKVYNVSHKMFVCHGISWGIPAILVAVTLSIAAGKEGIQSYVNDKYCWLSSVYSLIWIFASLVLLIELVNLAILVRVIKEMSSMQITHDSQTEQIRLCIKTCAVMTPLVGVSWLFGFFIPLHKAFIYIFVILNSTQGFFIFVLHCARNSEIRARLQRKLQTLSLDEEISKNKDRRVQRKEPSDDMELQ